MGKLFCLMGKSSSGKDTIYKRLLEMEELGLSRIIPYTTRPIREGETEGVEYHFVDAARKDQLLSEGKVLEIRSYNTAHGVWNYFTVDDGQIDLDHGDSLLIGTLDTYNEIRKHFDKGLVIPIYINVEDGERLSRALSRERAEASPKYVEMCRRFIADSQDFSEENLTAAGITKRFENVNIEETVTAVADYIKGTSHGYED